MVNMSETAIQTISGYGVAPRSNDGPRVVNNEIA